jgi:hypothetical protein
MTFLALNSLGIAKNFNKRLIIVEED